MELYFTRKMSQFPELVLPISYPSVFPVTLMLSGESTVTTCAMSVTVVPNCSVKGLYTSMGGLSSFHSASPKDATTQSMTTTATASDESQPSQSLCSFLSSQYTAPLYPPPTWL